MNIQEEIKKIDSDIQSLSMLRHRPDVAAALNRIHRRIDRLEALIQFDIESRHPEFSPTTDDGEPVVRKVH